MTNIEIWSKIEGYSRYLISSHGSLKSISRVVKSKNNSNRTTTERLIHGEVSIHGYNRIALYSDRCNRPKKAIHRLVALAFIPNPENKPCVNHKDGNKLNNHVDNLEWCTHSENGTHAILTGLIKVRYGTETSLSKLTESQVIEIRNSNLSVKQLSKIYSVHSVTIRSVRNYKTYNRLLI